MSTGRVGFGWLPALLALLSGPVAVLPYEVARRGADWLSEDGSAATFEPGFHQALRLLAVLLTAASTAIAIGIWPRRTGRSGPRRRRARAGDVYFAAIALVGLVLCSWQLAYWPWPTNYDFWHHAATLRALAGEGGLHPFVATTDPTPFATPYNWALALLLRLLPGPLSVFHLMALAGVVNYLILFAGLYAFLGLFLDHRGRALCLLLLVALVGVERREWFDLVNLGQVLPYSSRFAIGATRWTLWGAARLVRERRPAMLALLAPAAALVLACHPMTGVFLFTALAVAAALGAVGRDGRATAWLTLTAVAGGLLALLWPLFPLASLLLADNPELHEANWRMFFRHGWRGVLLADWPQLILGLPALVWTAMAARRRRDERLLWLALTTIAMLALAALGTRPGLGALTRMLAPLALLLDLCVAWAVIDWLDRAPAGFLARRWRSVASVLLALWIPYLMIGNGRLLRKRWLIGVGQGVRLKVAGELSFLEAHVGRGDVVLADLSTSFKVPVFSRGKVVAAPHPLAFVNDHPERQLAVRRYFAPETGLDERARIARRYGARLVLMETASHGWLEADLTALGATQLAGSRRYGLWELPAVAGQRGVAGNDGRRHSTDPRSRATRAGVDHPEEPGAWRPPPDPVRSRAAGGRTGAPAARRRRTS